MLLVSTNHWAVALGVSNREAFDGEDYLGAMGATSVSLLIRMRGVDACRPEDRGGLLTVIWQKWLLVLWVLLSPLNFPLYERSFYWRAFVLLLGTEAA